jgi:hypothetical protein
VSKQEQDLSILDISTLTTDDPEALAGQILGEPEDTPKDEPKEEPKDEPKEAEKPDEGKKADDGPGNVRKALNEARARLRKEEETRAQRERELADLKKVQEELEAKVKAAAEKPAEPELKPESPSDTDLDTVIKSIEEDAPDLAKALRVQSDRDRAQMAEIASLKETIGKLNEQIGGVVKRDQDAEKEAQQAAQAEVDKAIEATPKLAYLRDLAETDATIASMWEAAIAEDQVLKSRGRWQNEPFAKRFSEVVSRVERDFGEIKLPPEYLNKEEIEARAKKAADSAKPHRPSTLSDLPGGTPPAPDALGSLESADPASLMNSLLSASDVDKALEDMLAKVG